MHNEGKYECVTSFHFEIDEPVIFLLLLNCMMTTTFIKKFLFIQLI